MFYLIFAAVIFTVFYFFGQFFPAIATHIDPMKFFLQIFSEKGDLGQAFLSTLLLYVIFPIIVTIITYFILKNYFPDKMLHVVIIYIAAFIIIFISIASAVSHAESDFKYSQKFSNQISGKVEPSNDVIFKNSRTPGTRIYDFDVNGNDLLITMNSIYARGGDRRFAVNFENNTIVNRELDYLISNYEEPIIYQSKLYYLGSDEAYYIDFKTGKKTDLNISGDARLFAITDNLMYYEKYSNHYSASECYYYDLENNSSEKIATCWEGRPDPNFFKDGFAFLKEDSEWKTEKNQIIWYDLKLKNSKVLYQGSVSNFALSPGKDILFLKECDGLEGYGGGYKILNLESKKETIIDLPENSYSIHFLNNDQALIYYNENIYLIEVLSGKTKKIDLGNAYYKVDGDYIYYEQNDILFNYIKRRPIIGD